MLHAKYGIIIFVMILVLIIKSIKFLAKNHDYELLGLLLGLLFRMNFDYTNFNGWLDVVLMFFLFYPYYHKDDEGIDKYEIYD